MSEREDPLAFALAEARQLEPLLAREAAPLADGLRALAAETDPAARRDRALDLYARFAWVRGLSGLLDVRVVRALSADPAVREFVVELAGLARKPVVRETLAAMSPSRFDFPEVAEAPNRVRRFAVALDEPAWPGGPRLRDVWIDVQIRLPNGTQVSVDALATVVQWLGEWHHLRIVAPPGSGGTTLLRRLAELLLEAGATPLPVDEGRPLPAEVLASQPFPIYLVDRGQRPPAAVDGIDPSATVRCVEIMDAGDARLLPVDGETAARWWAARTGEDAGSPPLSSPPALIVAAQAHAEGIRVDDPDHAARLLDRLAERLGGPDPAATRRAWRRAAWQAAVGADGPDGAPHDPMAPAGWPGTTGLTRSTPLADTLRIEHVVAALTPWLDPAMDLPEALFGAAWMNLFGRGRLPDGAVLRQARDALAPHHPALLDRLERLLDPLLRCALPHDPVAPDADPPHQTARIAAAALWPGRIPEALSQALARIGDASLEGVNAPIRSLPNARHTHFVEVDTTLHRAWHSDCSLTESASLFLTESIFVRSRLVHHGSHAYLESNTFIACTLTGSGWRVATWLRCQLNDCVLAGDFRDALFHLCSFDGVDMSEANLTGASLRLCDTAGNAFDDDWAQRSERNAGLRGLAGPDHLRSAAVANAAAAPEALAELEAWLDAHDDWSDEPGHAFALEDGRFVHAFTPEAVPRVAARWLAARPR